MFEAIHSRLERISQYAVWVGGAALLAAAVMVTLDVFARKFFSITMSGSDEYSGYVFSATTTMAYSYCLLHRSNVRIDALYNLLPRKVTAFLDVIGLSLLLYYMSIMSYYAVISFVDSWVNNSVSITTLGTPQWIPQLFWLFGLALFFITLIFSCKTKTSSSIFFVEFLIKAVNKIKNKIVKINKDFFIVCYQYSQFQSND